MTGGRSTPSLVGWSGRGDPRASPRLWQHREALTAIGFLALLCGSVAFVLGQLGPKGGVVAVAGIGLAIGLLIVRDRPLLVLVVLVLGLQFLFHKSFGPINQDIASGASAFYITSVDVLLVVLYGLWLLEFRSESETGAPSVGSLALLPALSMAAAAPSLLAAQDLWLAAAEMVRMGWMFALFAYVALRVESRRQILAVLLALFAIVIIQFVVTSAQWHTGSTLGLDLLGEEASFGTRVTAADEVPRPSGTVVHPVFLGALVGPIGLLALSLAINLRTWVRYLCLALVPLAFAPMVFGQTRAALVGFAVAVVALCGASWLQGRLSWRAIGIGLCVLAVVGLGFREQITTKVLDNLGTDHFWLEVESRLELNRVALDIIREAPLFGVGLNNFEAVLDRFDTHGLLFAGNPVHNLYLLVWSETGLIGLLALVAQLLVILWVAFRLAWVDDRLLRGLGAGAAAIIVFFLVEELTVFSLREEMPLLLFWLLAGLVMAGARIAKADTQAARVRTIQGSSAPAKIQLASAVGALILVCGMGVLGPATVSGQAESAVDQPFAQRSGGRIVFSAKSRGAGALLVGAQQIYSADVDGQNLRRLTPDDGLYYDWPMWAMNGTRVVFQALHGSDPAGEQSVLLMEPEGSNRVQLATMHWNTIQPRISPDGTSLIFTASWPEFPIVALYRMDLQTGLVENLSAVTRPEIGLDSDPKWSPDGKQIVLTSGPVESGVVDTPQIYVMNADGTERRRLTEDRYWHTDPSLSPDGRYVASSSYRGEAYPYPEGSGGTSPFLWDWHLVVIDLITGEERVLTEGLRCSERSIFEAPCRPEEGPAWAPVWSADSRRLSYLSSRGPGLSGVYAIGVDGSSPQILFESRDVAITWYDWTEAAGPFDGPAPRPRVEAPQLVYTARSFPTSIDEVGHHVVEDGGELLPGRLFLSSGDRWQSIEIRLEAQTLVPETARWTPDRGRVLMTASTPLEAPPAEVGYAELEGLRRYTSATKTGSLQVIEAQRDATEEQVFLVSPGDGTVAQLTTAWERDPLDGRPVEPRAHTEPDLSPDGRYLFVTSAAPSTGGSEILRVDLTTGETLNLTSLSCGGVLCIDTAPRVSPDGSRLAFNSLVGGYVQILVMDIDGHGMAHLTDDAFDHLYPAWSSDGQWLAYSRTRSPTRTRASDGASWSSDGLAFALVKLNSTTGEEVVLTEGAMSIARPRWEPDGNRVGFIGTPAQGQPDIYVVSADGGVPRPLAITTTTVEQSFDWW